MVIQRDEGERTVEPPAELEKELRKSKTAGGALAKAIFYSQQGNGSVHPRCEAGRD